MATRSLCTNVKFLRSQVLSPLLNYEVNHNRFVNNGTELMKCFSLPYLIN